MSPVSDEQAAAYLRLNPGFRQTSGNDFERTGQTIRYMCSLINRSTDPAIVERAWRDAWERFSAMTGGDPAACAWWYAKTLLTFVHHSKMAGAWLGDPDALQLLIEPAALLKMRDPKGDCAVYTTFICALLNEAGVPWEIVTVAVDPRQPGVFSHVYPRAVLENGQRLPLDASHGSFPGWEVPASRISRKQVWGETGWPVADEQSNEGVSGMAGLGCACRNNGLGEITIDFPDNEPVNYNWADLSGSGSAPSGWPQSSQPSALASTLSNLGTAWTGIASNILAPMTTYRSPSGAVLSTPANQTANAALLTGGGSLLSSPSSGSFGLMPIILIGGVIALFALKK